MAEQKLRFRPNVAGILQRPDDGRILVAERVDFKGAWQFPQGGVDKGEDLKAAFFREMEEEIGLESKDYEIVRELGGYRYAFPPERKKRFKFDGQEQTYFLCRFTGEEASIRLDKHNREFADYQWVAPDDFDLDWLPPFKQEVYAKVLRDFFGIDQ